MDNGQQCVCVADGISIQNWSEEMRRNLEIIDMEFGACWYVRPCLCLFTGNAIIFGWAENTSEISSTPYCARCCCWLSERVFSKIYYVNWSCFFLVAHIAKCLRCGFVSLGRVQIHIHIMSSFAQSDEQKPPIKNSKKNVHSIFSLNKVEKSDKRANESSSYTNICAKLISVCCGTEKKTGDELVRAFILSKTRWKRLELCHRVKTEGKQRFCRWRIQHSRCF